MNLPAGRFENSPPFQGGIVPWRGRVPKGRLRIVFSCLLYTPFLDSPTVGQSVVFKSVQRPNPNFNDVCRTTMALSIAMAWFAFGWSVAASPSRAPLGAERVARAALMLDKTSFVLTGAINSPPIIITQPQSVATRAGLSVTFNVQATGVSSLQYQWLKNGVIIPGANQNSFTLSNIQSSDAATYTVVVSNSFGPVTSAPAALTVVAPLFITKQPTNQVAKAGADVTFTAQSSSSVPLNYFGSRTDC